MLEKEIKILEINKAEILKKLESLWAKKTFEGFIHDIYYDFPAWKMEWKKRFFRVRKKWEVHLYTIKRKRKMERLKAADEHEMEITDIDSFSRVLKKYGMNKVREKKKHRISYSLYNLEFDIDDYEWIPSLLEIEANSNEEIQFWVKKLSLENNKQKNFGSRGLFEYYNLAYKFF